MSSDVHFKLYYWFWLSVLPLNVDPLDSPAVTVNYGSDNVAILTWDPVDCAQMYVVEIPSLGRREMLESTTYTTPFLQTGVTYHGHIHAYGGSASQFTVIGVNISSEF